LIAQSRKGDTEMIIRKLIMSAGVLFLAGGGVTRGEESGKPKEVRIEEDVLIQRAPGTPGVPMLLNPEVSSDIAGGTFGWVASEMSFGGKPVKGAPYAAEAITESTQTLSDGNRIQRKSSASVYRDSEGRTRREQTLAAIGPWAASGEAPQTIFIDDSVAGVHYILNPKERTARKIMLKALVTVGDPVPTGKEGEFTVALGASHQAMRVERRIAGPGQTVAFQASGTWESALPKPQTESLGKRVIEGVEADGTRNTMTIPAGQVGNELPIQVISETWFSPELQAVVMSKHTDPRMGETSYRLTGISRSEQSRSLFEVPADYKIEEGGPVIQRFRNRKPEPSN
jgi:hypothetical protein